MSHGADSIHPAPTKLGNVSPRIVGDPLRFQADLPQLSGRRGDMAAEIKPGRSSYSSRHAQREARRSHRALTGEDRNGNPVTTTTASSFPRARRQTRRRPA